jgi:hypothetical protein
MVWTNVLNDAVFLFAGSWSGTNDDRSRLLIEAEQDDERSSDDANHRPEPGGNLLSDDGSGRHDDLSLCAARASAT